MYMPGRCRTGSRPLRTVMSEAVYEALPRGVVVAGAAFDRAPPGLAGALAEVFLLGQRSRPTRSLLKGVLGAANDRSVRRIHGSNHSIRQRRKSEKERLKVLVRAHFPVPRLPRAPGPREGL